MRQTGCARSQLDPLSRLHGDAGEQTIEKAPATPPPAATVTSADIAAGAELRRLIQACIHSFGLLTTDETPCGQALPTSYGHALMLLLGQRSSIRCWP